MSLFLDSKSYFRHNLVMGINFICTCIAGVQVIACPYVLSDNAKTLCNFCTFPDSSIGLEWVSFEGYEYVILDETLSYESGVEECKSHDAHVTSLLSHDQADFLVELIMQP